MQRDVLHTQQGRWYLKIFLWILSVEYAISQGWDYQAFGANWEEGVCLNGQVGGQSPINLGDSAVQPDTANSMYYIYPLLGDPVKLTNDGHGLVFTVPETYKGGFGLAEKPEDIFEGTPLTYRLWHVTFHSPSEHLRNGVRYPLEVQLTHKEATNGQLAVVSVFFMDGGQPHNFLDVMLEFGLPENSWDEVMVNRASAPPTSMTDRASKTQKIIDFYGLVNGGQFFKYDGSLTIPPCNPNVLWLVREAPIPAEGSQLAQFRDMMKIQSPPEGNYRAIQASAGRTITLIGATDINDPKLVKVGISNAVEPSGVKDTVDLNIDITGNPEYSRITGTETAEELSAKRAYQDARLSAEGAKVAYIKAKAALSQAQTLYDKAPGIVEKIDLKWVIIDKKNIVNAKTAQLSKAMDAYKVALDRCAGLVAAEKVEEQPTTTPLPTEAGSSDTATTRIPTMAPPVPTALPGQKMNYVPHYMLPRGPAGNPFIRNAAESTVSIGGSSGQPQYFPYLKQNLNQPEGSDASVPVPGLVMVTTTTSPPPTTAPPVAVDLRLNVVPSDISNMTKFKEELAGGIASTSGVDTSRVIVESVTATQTSVLLQKYSRSRRLKSPRQGALSKFLSAVF